MNTAFLARLGKFAAFAAILFLAAPSVMAAATGNANFILGLKAMDEDDWGSLDSQGEFGAEVSFGRDHWPVLIAIDLLGSRAEDTDRGIDFEASTSELDLGVRKIWEFRRMRPYVGGGIALINAELRATDSGITIIEDDDDVGAWVGGGLFWRLRTRVNIGIAVRYSRAQVRLFGADAEAGGIHAGMLLGWGWPAFHQN